MGNIDLARQLIDDAAAHGVREFCVCAGSRNSPLLAVLGASPFRLYSFVDERSAAFFALGRIKLTGAPVAVVTTSGTAVAELLPATIEAHYSGLPLVLITADRPARFRGTAAPQCIDQEGLFGVFAATAWSDRRPVHFNVEFDEPLIDGNGTYGTDRTYGISAADSSPTGPIRPIRPIGPIGPRPLVLIGGLAPHHRPRVKAFAQALNAPVYAEPLSGLREDADLRTLQSGERILGKATFNTVIRIGNVPTLRFWRDLEESRRDVNVLHFSDLPFTGLTRGEVQPIEALPLDVKPVENALQEFDGEMTRRFEALLDEEPQSELALLRDFSRQLPDHARLYLGNSLPIREWDLVAARESRGWTYEANRGANGIDGQLSTFFGQLDPARPNVAVLGDLTTIYDSNAPWIVPQLDEAEWRLAIVNNGGGRIFSRVPSLRQLDASVRERIIENHHHYNFRKWAESWNVEEHVTELRPDDDATARVWKRYDELWA
ncbi:MAG TPA: thiamine pyrophosphate-binding protein [Thermoanaerobaculia bacterium]